MNHLYHHPQSQRYHQSGQTSQGHWNYGARRDPQMWCLKQTSKRQNNDHKVQLKCSVWRGGKARVERGKTGWELWKRGPDMSHSVSGSACLCRIWNGNVESKSIVDGLLKGMACARFHQIHRELLGGSLSSLEYLCHKNASPPGSQKWSCPYGR